MRIQSNWCVYDVVIEAEFESFFGNFYMNEAYCQYANSCGFQNYVLA